MQTQSEFRNKELWAMLRVTVHHTSQAITFQLEGRLSRPWLQELVKCWRRTILGKGNPVVRVDLTGLTFVDDSGQACLLAMYHEGADFVANDCLTKSIVDEITKPRDSEADRKS